MIPPPPGLPSRASPRPAVLAQFPCLQPRHGRAGPAPPAEMFFCNSWLWPYPAPTTPKQVVDLIAVPCKLNKALTRIELADTLLTKGSALIQQAIKAMWKVDRLDLTNVGEASGLTPPPLTTRHRPAPTPRPTNQPTSHVFGHLPCCNAPNLNLLGPPVTRSLWHHQPEQMQIRAGGAARRLGVTLDCFQSNHEGRTGTESSSRWSSAGI